MVSLIEGLLGILEEEDGTSCWTPRMAPWKDGWLALIPAVNDTLGLFTDTSEKSYFRRFIGKPSNSLASLEHVPKTNKQEKSISDAGSSEGSGSKAAPSGKKPEPICTSCTATNEICSY